MRYARNAPKIGCVLPVLINVAEFMRKFTEHKNFEKDAKCKISVRGLNYNPPEFSFGQTICFLKIYYHRFIPTRKVLKHRFRRLLRCKSFSVLYRCGRVFGVSWSF